MNVSARLRALDSIAARYIERQRSLGRKYDVEERVVASLCRFLSDIRAEDLDLSRFEAWCSTFSDLSANVRRNRQRIVRNLCLYRRRTESGCFVPDLNRFPRSCPHEAPRIFEPSDVAKMAGRHTPVEADARIATDARGPAPRSGSALHRRPSTW